MKDERDLMRNSECGIAELRGTSFRVILKKVDRKQIDERAQNIYGDGE